MCASSCRCQVKNALFQVIPLTILPRTSGSSRCACAASIKLCSCQWLMLCSADTPTTFTLALFPRSKIMSARGLWAAMADHPSKPQAASTRVPACQSRCPSCQKAAACWNRSAAGWGCQWCSSWLGRAACCCGLYRAWVSNTPSGLVKAAARQLLAGLPQAPPGTQQPQHVQA